MWKPHPLLPHAIEIQMAKGYWWQGIEVKEEINHCSSCKEWGHATKVCIVKRKGEKKAEEVLRNFIVLQDPRPSNPR